MNNEVFAVILAGGSGTRFWPKSRHRSPKQLCAIGDTEATMLEVTLGRLEGFIPPERRIIVTHTAQAAKTREIAGNRCKYVIEEPFARNTAPALAMAALEVQKLSGSSAPLMISLHADSVVRNVNKYIETLKRALEVADRGHLTLLGIKPDYPETGYGYLEKGQDLEPGLRVKKFREKPSLEVAKEYLQHGGFFWNSGIFVWKNDVFLSEMREHLPEVMSALEKAGEEFTGGFSSVTGKELNKYYGDLQSISIDHGLLEVSKNVAMVESDFGWQDVGSWSAMDKCFKTDRAGNYLSGDIYTIDTENSTIDTDGAFVATIGISDLVVVSAKNAVLVCPKDRAQEVKRVVEYLKESGRTELT